MKQRPESSVSPDFNEYGELVFSGALEHGAVIHRTPEELGLPRVVVDAPVRPSWYVRDESPRKEAFAAQVNRLRRQLGKAPLDVRPDWTDKKPRGTQGKKRDRLPQVSHVAQVAQQRAKAQQPERRIAGMTETVAVNKEGQKKRGGVIKRHPAPKVEVVKMEAVPDPPASERHNFSPARALYASLLKLEPGTAVKAEFATADNGEYVRYKMRKLAKEDGRQLSSSRNDNGTVRYFWLEAA